MLWFGLGLLLTGSAFSQPGLAPYANDVHTVYLFHFDEPPGSEVATNSAVSTSGQNGISFDGDPFAGDGVDQPSVTTVLGATGYTNFGNCADLSSANDLGIGLDVSGDGGFMIDDGSPISDDRLPNHSFFGPGNVFTLEALVKLPSITGSNREIISTDDGSANFQRGFQFRINTIGELEFNFIGVSAASAVTAPIPTTGFHAFVPNEWFHVALVYDGSNAWFYWTRLDYGDTAANLIGGPEAEGVDANDDALLVFGNEGRASGSTGSTEGLLGSIDEVRISDVARSATDFYWQPKPYTVDSNTVYLFHFDEPAGSVAAGNETGVLAAGTNAVPFDGNPFAGDGVAQPTLNTVLGAGGASGFGNAADLSASQEYGVGVDANLDGSYTLDDGSPLSPDRFPTHDFFGPSNQFTIEALVNLPSITSGNNREIVSTDTAGNTDALRGFQFRVNTGGSGRLEFNFIGGLDGAYLADIPTNGPNAFVPNQWFHAAVTYDGSAVRLYWTRLDAANSTANLIGGPTNRAVNIDDDMLLVLGNEGRVVGTTGSTEGLGGLIDEVRISNVARSAYGFYWGTDSDDDGLPDVWERLYFGSLSQSGTNDFDLDEYNNLAELEAGSDPTNELSTPDDLDADGLPDAWEQMHFGTLAYNASDDPDNDGYTNAEELAGGSDPASPNSLPGDLDGDTLPDQWETNNLGTLAYGAYDDPDIDGYDNQAEYAGGTLPLVDTSYPSWQAPRVALLRDSVATTNACLMPANATYGRAINGVSFQDQIVLTVDGYQYTAWYDTVGTTQLIWLARRTVDDTSVGPWETFQTDSEFLNGDENAWDAHDVIALGICPADGTLHMSWDMHGQLLRYRRSVVGLCTTNKGAWGSGMLGPEVHQLSASDPVNYDQVVTYPQFITTPDGKLIFDRRYGGSGNGDDLLQHYDPTTGTWGPNTLYIARTGNYFGSTSRNAYLNGFDFGPDGTIHVSWTWREGSGSANHDICYAYSSDDGVTWRNNAGTIIADTSIGEDIDLNSPGIIIKPLDTRQLLINQQAQCVDNDGRVHVLMLHRREDPGYEYPNYTTANFSTLATAYYHYFRDPDTGQWSQRRIPPDVYPVGARPTIGFDSKGNVYAAYISYPAGTDVVPGYTFGKLVVASASKDSQYTDWEVVQVINMDYDGEPLLDQERLLSDNVLSIFIQDHSASASVVGTPLHVYDFAVDVKEPAPVGFSTSLNFFGTDVVIVVPSVSGHTYQLRVATTLSPPDWANVGPVVPGVDGLLALPDLGGADADQRYYGVVRDP